MTNLAFRIISLLSLLFLAPPVWSQENAGAAKENVTADAAAPLISGESLPKGARLFVAPIQNGFETYIVAGLEKKKVPVVLVADRSKADYELSGRVARLCAAIVSHLYENEGAPLLAFLARGGCVRRHRTFLPGGSTIRPQASRSEATHGAGDRHFIPGSGYPRWAWLGTLRCRDLVLAG